MLKRSLCLAALIGSFGAGCSLPLRKTLAQGGAVPGEPVGRDITLPRGDPEAVSVIERYFTALGVREVFAEMRDATSSFQVWDQVSNAAFDMDHHFKAPAKFREEGRIWRTLWVTVASGGQGWGKTGIYGEPWGDPVALRGHDFDAYCRSRFGDDPCWTPGPGSTVSWMGRAMEDGAVLEILEVKPLGGRTEKCSFLEANGLLLRREWIDEHRGGKRTVVYKDYRRVPVGPAGRTLRVPLVTESYQDGALENGRRLTSFRVNVGVKEDLFKRPDGG